MSEDNFDSLYMKVKNLNELLWEGRATRPAIDQWLSNFNGASMLEEVEREHALYLLSKFLYFGQKEVRQLLRTMFQDLFRHRLSVAIRQRLVNRNDFEIIHDMFQDELWKTRFLGLGNAAESGAHILYDFRTANNLPLKLFANPHDLFSGRLDNPTTKWDPEVRRLVFIDDFCGTGKQAEGMGVKYVPLMQKVAKSSGIEIEAWYLTLLATTAGLNNLRQCGVFDIVESVSELDETYRVFDAKSQVYGGAPDDLTKADGEKIALHYGTDLSPYHPLGYGDCQLLLGFHHNVPDNTLPILSLERINPLWHAVFPRSEKV